MKLEIKIKSGSVVQFTPFDGENENIRKIKILKDGKCYETYAFLDFDGMKAYDTDTATKDYEFVALPVNKNKLPKEIDLLEYYPIKMCGRHCPECNLDDFI